MHCQGPPAARERPALEVADIFRAHGPLYRQKHELPLEQRKVMRAIEVCRTPALGGHLDVCTQCDYSRPSYNSCRDRHCPKCQSLSQARWIEQRTERLLPVHYFHVVFTLPASLRPLCRRNPERLYKLLFEAASQTLLQLGQDPKRLGGELGITAVLHTWTRELEFHPHLHCIVTGGGLAEDGTRWIAARRKYLFPVQVLSELFRGLFLDGLRRAHRRGELRTDGSDVDKLIRSLYETPWVVYAKRPFGGPEQVFKYLGRYTHRVGISNQRLISMDDRGVRFATKNGRAITLPPEEFIRRFLLHVLPPGFVKIRHYGLWASGRAATRLATARRLLQTDPAESAPGQVALASTDDIGRADEPAWQRRLRLLTGIDVTRCPHCQGRLERHPLPDTVPAPADTS